MGNQRRLNNLNASESLPVPAEMARQGVKVQDDPLRPFKFTKRLIARKIAGASCKPA
jgi:hypothetical protein